MVVLLKWRHGFLRLRGSRRARPPGGRRPRQLRATYGRARAALVCGHLRPSRIRDRLLVRNEALRAIGGSALTDATIAVPDLGMRFGPAFPSPTSHSATRIFSAVAVSWAEVLGAEKVYIGAVEPDSSGYPDCRPEYYRGFNEVVKAGTKDGRSGRDAADCDAQS